MGGSRPSQLAVLSPLARPFTVAIQPQGTAPLSPTTKWPPRPRGRSASHASPAPLPLASPAPGTQALMFCAQTRETLTSGPLQRMSAPLDRSSEERHGSVLTPSRSLLSCQLLSEAFPSPPFEKGNPPQPCARHSHPPFLISFSPQHLLSKAGISGPQAEPAARCLFS